MLFPFTTVCLVGLVSLARTVDNRRSPLVLVLSVWLGSLVLGPILFRYRVSYSFTADVFTGACLSAAALAYLLMRTPRQGAPAKDYPSVGLDIRLSQILGVVGILGSLILLVEAKNSGKPISLSYLVENLSMIRDDQFESLARSARQSSMTVLGTYLASCSYLTVVAAVRLGRVGGLPILGSINFVLITAASLLLYGGRATLFNLALMVVVGLYVSGRRLFRCQPRTLLVAIVAIAGIWYFSVPWLVNRESGSRHNPTAILAYTQRAEVRSPMDDIVKGDRSLGMALVSVGYFTSPLPTLSYYIQQDPLPGPLWGAYSFPLPTRTIAKLKGTWTPSMWLESRQQVFTPFTGAGYFPNVWSTVLRDLLVEFGYIGATLFFAAVGGFMALARNAFERTGQLSYHYLETFSCFILAFGAFTSLLNSTLVSSAFMLAMVMMLGTRTGVLNFLTPGTSECTQPLALGATASNHEFRGPSNENSSGVGAREF